MTIIEITYDVPGVSCAHCVSAIMAEASSVPGVNEVDVDLAAKRVTITGTELDDGALRAAIDEAGYDVA